MHDVEGKQSQLRNIVRCVGDSMIDVVCAGIAGNMMIMRTPFGVKVVVLVILGLSLMAMMVHPVHGAGRPGWGNAHITFYGEASGQGTQAGACGYQNTFALGYGAMTAALSTPLFRGGAVCGACFQIQCMRIRETHTAKNWCWDYGRSIVITATNLCPPGSEGGWCDPPRRHFDLSYPAYSNLARREGGVAPVYYRRYVNNAQSEYHSSLNSCFPVNTCQLQQINGKTLKLRCNEARLDAWLMHDHGLDRRAGFGVLSAAGFGSRWEAIRGF